MVNSTSLNNRSNNLITLDQQQVQEKQSFIDQSIQEIQEQINLNKSRINRKDIFSTKSPLRNLSPTQYRMSNSPKTFINLSPVKENNMTNSQIQQSFMASFGSPTKMPLPQNPFSQNEHSFFQSPNSNINVSPITIQNKASINPSHLVQQPHILVKERYNEEIQRKNQEIHNLIQAQSSIITNSQKRDEQLNLITYELEQLQGKYLAIYNQREIEINNYKKDINELTDKNTVLVKDLNNLIEKNTKIQISRDEELRQLKQSIIVQNEQQNDIAMYQQKLSQNIENLNEVQNKLADQQIQNSNLNQENKSLNQQLLNSKNYILSLESKQDEIVNRLVALELKNAQSVNDGIYDNIEKNQDKGMQMKEIIRLTDLLKQKQAYIDEQKDEQIRLIKELQEKNHSLELEQSKSIQIIEMKFIKDKQEIQDKVNQFRAECDSYQVSNKRFELDNQKLQYTIITLEQQINRIMEENRLKSQQIEDLKQIVGTTFDKEDKYKTQQQISENKEQLTQSNIENNQLKQQIQQLNQNWNQSLFENSQQYLQQIQLKDSQINQLKFQLQNENNQVIQLKNSVYQLENSFNKQKDIKQNNNQSDSEISVQEQQQTYQLLKPINVPYSDSREPSPPQIKKRMSMFDPKKIEGLTQNKDIKEISNIIKKGSIYLK